MLNRVIDSGDTLAVGQKRFEAVASAFAARGRAGRRRPVHRPLNSGRWAVKQRTLAEICDGIKAILLRRRGLSARRKARYRSTQLL